jgi:F0F1-type ATP synthase assembly protein I
MKEKLVKDLGVYTTLITELSILTASGIIIGFYVDKWLGTTPLFLIIGLTMGMFSGIRILLFISKKYLKRR